MDSPGTDGSFESFSSSELNEGFDVSQALRKEIEGQRKIELQLEAEKSIKDRVSSEQRYLEYVLERACQQHYQILGAADFAANIPKQPEIPPTKMPSAIGTWNPLGFYTFSSQIGPAEAVRQQVLPGEEFPTLYTNTVNYSPNSYLTATPVIFSSGTTSAEGMNTEFDHRIATRGMHMAADDSFFWGAAAKGIPEFCAHIMKQGGGGGGGGGFKGYSGCPNY
ncbi:hypothetical protein AQUCO_00500364v1 [Aquilegia coerulea]|uniref:Uncharacterized protein n=1 Tax=Aquilegia coerulea TaxID=218851 RepID=A0A2G5ERL8_AQUCA|nr:hypothetical protein AQUCO_00500364v1 [Aquilegia coerulea]